MGLTSDIGPTEPRCVSDRGKLILVVDDDRDIREAMRDVLTDEGYHVEAASNGAEALDLLRKGVEPAVILLDLMMPVMDGWTFRQRQRLEGGLAGIPVVLLTALGMGKAEVDRFGASECIRKPVDVDSLIDVIERTAV